MLTLIKKKPEETKTAKVVEFEKIMSKNVYKFEFHHSKLWLHRNVNELDDFKMWRHDFEK